MPASAASTLQAAWLSRGLLASTLLPLSWLYRLLFGIKKLTYLSGLRQVERLPVPMIVVGNLIVGGAGKTPTTLNLVRLLKNHGYSPGVLSRGYGRSSQEPLVLERDTPVQSSGDEPLLMHMRSGVPVAVGADRIAAGRALLAAHPEINVLVSDDGLQHWRMARDIQVIVFDERGAGNGWLLPAGPLREQLPQAVPARSLVLYNAAQPSTPLPGHVAQRRLAGLIPLADWWAGVQPRAEAHRALLGRPVLAAAGMAHPERFFAMLRCLGLDIVELALPDHHPYSQLPWPSDTPEVIVTEKDAVKLKPGSMGDTRVHVATLDFETPPDFARQLLQMLPPASIS